MAEYYFCQKLLNLLTLRVRPTSKFEDKFHFFLFEFRVVHCLLFAATALLLPTSSCLFCDFVKSIFKQSTTNRKNERRSKGANLAKTIFKQKRRIGSFDVLKQTQFLEFGVNFVVRFSHAEDEEEEVLTCFEGLDQRRSAFKLCLQKERISPNSRKRERYIERETKTQSE